jgi:hypothetical protein
VRFHTPQASEWTDHPATLPGEVAVICATCMELRHRLAVQKTVRADRKLIRDRERGYGPGTGDPFAGMRGDR